MQNHGIRSPLPGVAPRASLDRATALVSRIAAALLGGYAFIWGLSTLGIAGLVALGVAYDTARTLLMLLAFLVYLVVFLWAFAAPRAGRVWAVLLGGGGLMTGAAWMVQAMVTGSGA